MAVIAVQLAAGCLALTRQLSLAAHGVVTMLVIVSGGFV